MFLVIVYFLAVHFSFFCALLHLSIFGTQDTEEIYYFNFATGESTWDHPCDEHYRSLYERSRKEAEEKAKLAKDKERRRAKKEARKIKAAQLESQLGSAPAAAVGASSLGAAPPLGELKGPGQRGQSPEPAAMGKGLDRKPLGKLSSKLSRSIAAAAEPAATAEPSKPPSKPTSKHADGEYDILGNLIPPSSAADPAPIAPADPPGPAAPAAEPLADGEYDIFGKLILPVGAAPTLAAAAPRANGEYDIFGNLITPAGEPPALESPTDAQGPTVEPPPSSTADPAGGARKSGFVSKKFGRGLGAALSSSAGSDSASSADLAATVLGGTMSLGSNEGSDGDAEHGATMQRATLIIAGSDSSGSPRSEDE